MTNENKILKRKTLTLPNSFYEKIKRLDDEVRLCVLDTIFKFFFEGKSFCYSDFNSESRIALACLMPDLRQAQAVFDNGKVAKKIYKNSQGSFCPVEPSKIKQNEAKEDSSIYNNTNNIYNNTNNIYNNTNNKQTKNNQPVECTSENYTKVMEKIEELKASQVAVQFQTTLVRLDDLIQRLKTGKEFLVNGQLLKADLILNRYLQLFERNPEVSLKKISKIFNQLDEACSEKKISNSFKYSISLFYNQALIREPIQKTESDFSQRNYSAEEMNSLFDSLDDIEL